MGLSWVSRIHSILLMPKHVPLWPWLSKVSYVYWAWQMSILSHMHSHRSVGACVLRGDLFSQLLLSSAAGMAHACQWSLTHPLRTCKFFSDKEWLLASTLLQLKRLSWEVRMFFRHYLMSTVSPQQKISVTLSIFIRRVSHILGVHLGESRRRKDTEGNWSLIWVKLWGTSFHL